MRNYIKEFMDDNGIAEDEHFLIEGEKSEFHYHKGGMITEGEYTVINGFQLIMILSGEAKIMSTDRSIPYVPVFKPEPQKAESDTEKERMRKILKQQGRTYYCKECGRIAEYGENCAYCGASLDWSEVTEKDPKPLSRFYKPTTYNELRKMKGSRR